MMSAFTGPLSLQRHLSASTKFVHVKSWVCGRKRQGKATFDTLINPCVSRACSRSVAVGLWTSSSRWTISSGRMDVTCGLASPIPQNTMCYLHCLSENQQFVRRETMAASKEAILLALENSIFEFPEMPGRWELLDFPGVRAHATPQTSHPIGNLVGISTLTEENAHSVIAQVRDFFAARDHTVGWWVNPSSTPGDLIIRLEAAGFAKVLEQAGQVLTNMGLEIKVNP